MTAPVTALTRKDFMSDQLIRWCPGCGDYSILAQTQTVLAEIGLPKEKTVFVSGIGCSSRFPYYMNTYGFHTIHGRAPGIATGLKATRPDLSVWVITGDGDALSIGGNHFIHVLRRNVDVNYLLFDNRIYGLTKGQYSPTSELGKKTKSSPMGTVDAPFDPIRLALGAGATFVARSVDVFASHLREVLHAAHAHRGTSLVHLYQNCNIFNDGAFDHFAEKSVRDERVLYLEAGKPMTWGVAERRGITLHGLTPQIIPIHDDADLARCVVHDPNNLTQAQLLAAFDPDAGWPVPVGVYYQTQRAVFEDLFQGQVLQAQQRAAADLQALLNAGDTWDVE